MIIQERNEKDLGGTGLTEGDALSVSVPADQLPHDAMGYSKDALAAAVYVSEQTPNFVLPDIAGTEPRPQDWIPIIVSVAPSEPLPARSAWLYEESCGVRLGTFGRFADGCAFATVPGLHGCFIRDWGATHYMFSDMPEPPIRETI